MKKFLVTCLATAALAVGASPAFAADKHPPKFGVHDKQCSSGANQPQCPGNH